MPDKKIYTDSGIEVKQVYTQADTAGNSIANEQAGQFPFTRGVQPD
ncbi:MAG: hypothetical protein JSU05_12410, partial [Bacteroidetes bacterium]|nr:hypothetical protein [Bacteroidota bacterium]